MILTPAQQALLDRVNAEGTVVLNGRGRRPAEALAALGLAYVEYDMVPHAKGGGLELTQQITLTKKA